MTAADLDKALKTAESAKGDTGALGKVITSYAWYFVCKADVADLQKVQNGTRLDVAIKDSDRVLSCTVVSGADTNPAPRKRFWCSSVRIWTRILPPIGRRI